MYYQGEHGNLYIWTITFPGKYYDTQVIVVTKVAIAKNIQRM